VTPDIPADARLVLVVVGTDHHPFDRVVAWMDRWAARHPDFFCVVQFGTSQSPRICSGVDYLGHTELQSLMRRAAAVVSHGGPGTIMEIRSTGLEPVVVARDPARGEHVDGHQQRFVELMSRRGLVRQAMTEAQLDEHIGALLSRPRGASPPAAHTRGVRAAATFGALVDPLIAKRRNARCGGPHAVPEA
jgi:UDP-N-acetylglucosamine transferase subunit ALG13